jgi:hypothetical protein
MEIGLALPDEDETATLAEAAYVLAVAQFGEDPPFEEVRRIFWRLVFEGDRTSDG